MSCAMVRSIVLIDEEKCDGCGLCVPACAEGAIRVVGGKARLVSDALCDGLGACLGECPRGAIRIIEREAAPFDATLAGAHPQAQSAVPAGHVATQPAQQRSNGAAAPALRQWPVQLALLSPRAPFLAGADLLLCADCVPFASSALHTDLLRGQALAVCCPKLDAAAALTAKLAAVIAAARPASITAVHMEVPCCFGLVRMLEMAMATAGAAIPLYERVVTTQGHLLPLRPLHPGKGPL